MRGSVDTQGFGRGDAGLRVSLVTLIWYLTNLVTVSSTEI